MSPTGGGVAVPPACILALVAPVLNGLISFFFGFSFLGFVVSVAHDFLLSAVVNQIKILSHGS